MARYIFVTYEGFTQQPMVDGDDEPREIENLQVIGYADGHDAKEAFDNLLKECGYLMDTNFCEVVAHRLDDEKDQHFSIPKNAKNNNNL